MFIQVRFVLGVIGLVAHRIPAGILVEINVAVLLHAPPDFLRRAVMALFRGVDEVVIGAAHRLHHRFEARHVAVAQLAGGQALLGGGLLHLLAVLVGAGQEIDVVAVEPHEPGNGVGRNRLIGVADMRHPVRVGNRSGDVERRFCRALGAF